MFRWETQEERLRKFMAISPKRKMEWLGRMHKLLRKIYPKKKTQFYFKLRENLRRATG